MKKTKNKYLKQYETLKNNVIKDIKERYKVLKRKYKNDDDFFRNSLNEDSSIFIDSINDDDDEFRYQSIRFISDIDTKGVSVDTSAWGTVGCIEYKKLTFEILCNLLDSLNRLK